MAVETIKWENGKIKMIDQTKLPLELVYVETDDINILWDSIKRLVVRGAPAIGVAAGFGVALAALKSRADKYEDLQRDVYKAIDYLATSRPTAVNLFWSLERMKRVLEKNKEKSVKDLKEILFNEAQKILEDDRERCRKIGENGKGLIKDGIGILTHCNAGALATGGIGTALASIFVAKKEGKNFTVYVGETRPLLQGGRLTAWELMQHNIDTILISDNMAAQVMKEGKINIAITGADRIALNGDAANKIGTYGVATLAKAHNIPFYIAAPVSTIDFSIKTGLQIPIEERSPEEITEGFGKRTAPYNIKVYNPAFDVTPFSLISGIITEKGIIKPPF
ncbi:MAG: S-methyl-5-thioribose-1-phosphate isomerase, partial [Candidatus Auribacterota bacterium]|nr:S-methyl-5-thioribose-1-phosphate isomerase [Candidatus Auribacterota bacterium]